MKGQYAHYCWHSGGDRDKWVQRCSPPLFHGPAMMRLPTHTWYILMDLVSSVRPRTFTVDCLTWKCAMICDRSPSSLPSPSPPNDMFSVRHVPTKKRPVPNPHSKIDSAPPTLMKSVSCEESMASEWSVLSKLPNLICSWYDRHTHYDRDDDVILGWALIGNSS